MQWRTPCWRLDTQVGAPNVWVDGRHRWRWRWRWRNSATVPSLPAPSSPPPVLFPPPLPSTLPHPQMPRRLISRASSRCYGWVPTTRWMLWTRCAAHAAHAMHAVLRQVFLALGAGCVQLVCGCCALCAPGITWPPA